MSRCPDASEKPLSVSRENHGAQVPRSSAALRTRHCRRPGGPPDRAEPQDGGRALHPPARVCRSGGGRLPLSGPEIPSAPPGPEATKAGKTRARCRCPASSNAVEGGSAGSSETVRDQCSWRSSRRGWRSRPRSLRMASPATTDWAGSSKRHRIDTYDGRDRAVFAGSGVHDPRDRKRPGGAFSPMGGIESFRSHAKRRHQKFNGLRKASFPTALKETEFRFDTCNQDLYKILLTSCGMKPLGR